MAVTRLLGLRLAKVAAAETPRRRSYLPELAGGAAAAALPTAAAIQAQQKLLRLRKLVEAAKEVDHAKMRELARAGDVVLESEPAKMYHGFQHGAGTLAAGSPLTHAELMGPDLNTFSGGHDVSATAKGGTLHAEPWHRLFRGVEKGNPLAPLTPAEEREAARRRKWIDRFHAGRETRSPAGHRAVYSYFDDLEKDKFPALLMRRASGKELTPAELEAFRTWLSKSSVSTYDAPGILKNVLKGLFVPEIARGGRIKGFNTPCKSHVCTSLAGDALKGLGGLQGGRNTMTLPIDLAVDPLAKIKAVTGKETILKHLRTARINNALVRGGVIGATGLAGAGTIAAARKLLGKKQEQPGPQA